MFMMRVQSRRCPVTATTTAHFLMVLALSSGELLFLALGGRLLKSSELQMVLALSPSSIISFTSAP